MNFLKSKALKLVEKGKITTALSLLNQAQEIACKMELKEYGRYLRKELGNDI
jgi:hypothetical protein